jgi:nitroreductase
MAKFAVTVATVMDTFTAISRRRAIKDFDPSHVIPEADIAKVIDAAMQSPSSFNLQHWRFVLVRDKALRQELRAAAYNQPQVTEASLLVVVTADLKAWARQPERYWRNAPEEVAQKNLAAIPRSYSNNAQLERDEAMRSCGMAGMALMLAAQSLGYDSCPMVGFRPEKVAELLRLPADHLLAFLVALGKAIQPPWPKPGPLTFDEVVIQERFS